MGIIAVWGKGGSGVSTTAANIAVTLSKNNLVGLIGSRKDYGSIHHYFGMELQEQKSLKNAIEAQDREDVVKNFMQYPPRKDLFVLGMADTEGIKNISEDSAVHLLKVCSEAFDYVVIDCTPYFSDALTAIGCIKAEKIIQVIRPTIQDIAYVQAQEKFIEMLEIKSKIIPVCNINKNYMPLNLIEKKLELKFFEVLSASKEVEKSGIKGVPVCMENSFLTMDYRKGIRNICNRIEISNTITVRRTAKA